MLKSIRVRGWLDHALVADKSSVDKNSKLSRHVYLPPEYQQRGPRLLLFDLSIPPTPVGPDET